MTVLNSVDDIINLNFVNDIVTNDLPNPGKNYLHKQYKD